MHTSLLDVLRCPYCGTALSVVENDALAIDDEHMREGVLGCECCAYPVVSGIPVLIANEPTRRALHALDAGRSEEALFDLLGLAGGGAREEHLRALLDSDEPTYREALGVLCEDAEADYCLHRFTDPTYVTAEALLRAIAAPGWPLEGRVLDLCGGSGHLTRVLDGLRPPGEPRVPRTFLADLKFWKLWLAGRFMVPDAALICCDANSPLPFAPETFSLVHLADAFPYVWHKRLLADEMMRLAGQDGVVVMPHLHSALGQNLSAGDTLPPAAYRSLFAAVKPRLFSDRAMFEDVVERSIVDLTCDVSAEELGGEPTSTLVATTRDDLFARYEVPPAGDVAGALTLSPLYRLERNGSSSVLTLTFPTPEYEEEFGACRRYLPDHVTVQADLTGPIAGDSVGAEHEELHQRRVLVDAPIGYC